MSTFRLKKEKKKTYLEMRLITVFSAFSQEVLIWKVMEHNCDPWLAFNSTSVTLYQ